MCYTSHITHHTSHITHHTSHITHHTSYITHLGALISLFTVQPLLHLLQHLCHRQSEGVKIMFYGGSFMANGSWLMVSVSDVLSFVPLQRQHDRRWICKGRALRPPRSCRAWRTCAKCHKNTVGEQVPNVTKIQWGKRTRRTQARSCGRLFP